MKIGRPLLLLLGWLGVGAVIGGFFLPWVSIHVHEPELMRRLRQTTPFSGTMDGLTHDIGRIAIQVRRGAEVITGELPSLADLPQQVSGFRIPQIANQENTKAAMALAELLTQQRHDISRQSYAVYVLPGVALLCGVLLSIGRQWLPVTLGVAILCAAVALAGFWKALTFHTTTPVVTVLLGSGLWLSLWGYVGLVIAAGLLAVACVPAVRRP